LTVIYPGPTMWEGDSPLANNRRTTMDRLDYDSFLLIPASVPCTNYFLTATILMPLCAAMSPHRLGLSQTNKLQPNVT
jgi:hypothetical protein